MLVVFYSKCILTVLGGGGDFLALADPRGLPGDILLVITFTSTKLMNSTLCYVSPIGSLPVVLHYNGVFVMIVLKMCVY